MLIEFTWPVIGAISSFILAWTGLFIKIASRLEQKAKEVLHTELAALQRSLAHRLDLIESNTVSQIQRLDKQIERLDAEKNTHYTELRRLEDSYRNFLAQIPHEYVRQEDWVRASNRIDAKQDQLAELIRGIRNNG